MRYFSNILSIKRRLGDEVGGEWAAGFLLLLALGISILFFVGEQMLWGRLQHELEEAAAVKDGLQRINHYLRVEKASLASPERLASEARKMGFRTPKEEQIVPIDIKSRQTRPGG